MLIWHLPTCYLICITLFHSLIPKSYLCWLWHSLFWDISVFREREKGEKWLFLFNLFEKDILIRSSFEVGVWKGLTILTQRFMTTTNDLRLEYRKFKRSKQSLRRYLLFSFVIPILSTTQKCMLGKLPVWYLLNSLEHYSLLNVM